MTIEYLKKATKTPETETDTARKVVSDMLADIERRGEQAVRDYAAKLDSGPGTSLSRPRRSSGARATFPPAIKRDIEWATAQVRTFALAQRDSIKDFARRAVARG